MPCCKHIIADYIPRIPSAVPSRQPSMLPTQASTPSRQAVERPRSSRPHHPRFCVRLRLAGLAAATAAAAAAAAIGLLASELATGAGLGARGSPTAASLCTCGHSFRAHCPARSGGCYCGRVNERDFVSSRGSTAAWATYHNYNFIQNRENFLHFSTFSIFTRFFSIFTRFFSILNLAFFLLFCNILRSEITFQSGTSNVMHVPCVPTKGHELRPRGSSSNPARNIQ